MSGNSRFRRTARRTRIPIGRPTVPAWCSSVRRPRECTRSGLSSSDGTGLRRLTPDCPPGAGVPTCRADDGWPKWSPDGKYIAFQRLTGALRPNGATVNDAKAIYKDELTIMDADGGHTAHSYLAGAVAG